MFAIYSTWCLVFCLCLEFSNILQLCVNGGMAILACFVLLLFPGAEEHVFVLGKEDLKCKALQAGVYTHVAACLAEKVRSKIDQCLEGSSENKSGAVVPLVLPSQESLTHLRGGFERDRTDQRLV